MRSVYEYDQSESGNYYRDTNPIQNASRGNLRTQPSRPGSRSQASDYNRTSTNLMMSTFNGLKQGRIPIEMNQFGVIPPPDLRMTMVSTINRPISPAVNLGGLPQPGIGTIRPMSNFSVTTTAYGVPSNTNPMPSNEELYDTLKAYLSTQDLMTVTKRCV